MKFCVLSEIVYQNRDQPGMHHYDLTGHSIKTKHKNWYGDINHITMFHLKGHLSPDINHWHDLL